MHHRPCFLVVDSEHSGAISTRKLVLETAKYNVITAYSCDEAAAELERFPRVDAVVMNESMPGEACQGFLEGLRERLPEVKLLIVGDYGRFGNLADRVVPGFMPAELLLALQEMFPAAGARLQQHEVEIQRRNQ